MTSHDNPSVVNQDVENANSPEVIELRDSNNEVPEEVAGYDVVKVTLTETASAATEVRIQSYDNDNAQVEREVVVNLAADETLELSDDDLAALSVRRGNQIRVATDSSDVEVALYLAADGL